jgi:hypothetical protein
MPNITLISFDLETTSTFSEVAGSLPQYESKEMNTCPKFYIIKPVKSKLIDKRIRSSITHDH